MQDRVEYHGSGNNLIYVKCIIAVDYLFSTCGFCLKFCKAFTDLLSFTPVE